MRNSKSSSLLNVFMPMILCLMSLRLTSSSASPHRDRFLSRGSSLSVDDPDHILTSPTDAFAAGFRSIGGNAYYFAVWFSNQSCKHECVIWMANRDKPVSGIHSRFLLTEQGNLVLTDDGAKVVWSSDTALSSLAPDIRLHLLDSGNLILRTSVPNPGENGILWQSFDHPTDTLLPEQKFTRYTTLVSPRARGNVSSGYYKLYFDDFNVLRLRYDGPEMSSIYWPRPDRPLSTDTGRTATNDNPFASLDSLGNFTSSDCARFQASDYSSKIPRRLSLDRDGNIRLYSLLRHRKWAVSWQAISTPCHVHGICGPNAVCGYKPGSGKACSCAPGYERKNPRDWSEGCKPEFESFCALPDPLATEFLSVRHLDFYGNDESHYPNYTLSQCKQKCLELCTCKGFDYLFSKESGKHDCYLKLYLMNGRSSASTSGTIYFRMPKDMISSYRNVKKSSALNCSHILEDVPLRSHSKLLVKVLLILAGVIAGLETLGVLLVWSFITGTRQVNGEGTEGYHLAAMGYRRYTYPELKKATRNFREKVGRGATGSVYKAILPDHRTAAVKRLDSTILQGENDFLAEVRMIGKLNHMNLIAMWGYCAEGKHRLLVYEYMELGSLAEHLSNSAFDWEKRFDVALGTARGLAYLHDECLEWVLHCDVKPQNILLDSRYRAKVADLGLSKLVNRGDMKNSGFSKIRGTRGYMAPEWVYNLPITSKVDVYSFGIVLLEMVTGRRPGGVEAANTSTGEGDAENQILAAWLREKLNEDVPKSACIEEIVDCSIEGEYDLKKVEALVAVALECVADDKDNRPTMSRVVEMLQLCVDDAEN